MTIRRITEVRAVPGAAVVLSLLLAGCASATIEDAVPAAALSGTSAQRIETSGDATTTSAQSPAATAPASAFATPGDYPNLNIIPTPATSQITAEEKRDKTVELRARRDQQAGEAAGRGVRDQSADLRRLARRHAAEALKALEETDDTEETESE